MLRSIVLLGALLALPGCCCWPGGGGGEGRPAEAPDGGMFSAAREKAAKRAAELVVEKATGLERVEVDEKTGQVTITTPEGTAVVQASDEHGTMTFKSDQGSFQIAAGAGAKLQEGFPLPVYPGATTTSAVHNQTAEGDAWIATFQSADSPQQVAAFYEPHLNKLGVVTKNEIEAGGKRVFQFMVEGEGRQTLLMVSQQDADAVIAVTIGPK